MTDASGRDSFQHYRALMDAHGFRPSRRFGQNFLLEPSLHRLIADAVAVAADDVVLEVGPGLGFLTRELAARAGLVVAVEIDPRLAAILATEVRTFAGGDRVRLLVRDVLERGAIAVEVDDALGEARQARTGRLLVVANLPYSVTGPFLASVVQLRVGAPDAMAILVQAEFAERLVAPPGAADYGGPSALLQAGYRVELIRRVGREVFRPRPNVDSAIVRLERRTDSAFASLGPVSRGRFAVFIRALFASPRKTLRHAAERIASTVGLDAAIPAERLGDRPGDVSPDAALAWFVAGERRAFDSSS